MRQSFDRNTRMLLKLAAVALPSVGAVIALFGDAHDTNGLTHLGYGAFGIVVAGLAFALVSELADYREAREERRKERVEDSASRAWTILERQPLSSLALSFQHRWELPVTEFMDYLAGIRIEIRTADASSSRLLRPEKVAETADAEAAYVLTVSSGGIRIANSKGVSFARRTEPRESRWPLEGRPVGHHEAPNTASERAGQRISAPTTIESISMVVGDWVYTSSNRFSWQATDLACGLYATLPWNALDLPPAFTALRSVGDLEVMLTLPCNMDLRPVDRFELTFFGVGSPVGTLELEGLEYGQREDTNEWQTTLQGPEIYAGFARSYLTHWSEHHPAYTANA